MDLAKKICKKFGIGITGGIGTGKSKLLKTLAELGYPCADADQFAREVTKAGSKPLKAIASYFGAAAINANGSMNRSFVAKKVFSSPDAKRHLEGIVHPAIHERLGQWLAENGLLSNPRYFFYEASLLIETGSFKYFREIWLASCPKKMQVERLRRRDGCSESEALAIIAQQLSDAEKRKAADIVIDTTVDSKTLAAKIRKLVQERITLASDLAPRPI